MADDPKFVVGPLDEFGGRRVAVAVFQPRADEVLEVLVLGVAVGGAEFGDEVLPEGQFDVAPLGDALGVRDGFGPPAEEVAHFVRAAEVDLVRGKSESVVIVDHGVGLDTQEGVVGLGVFLVDVVDVVRGDKREAVMLGHLGEHGIELVLLGNAVVHKLDEEVVLAENLDVFLESGVGGVEVAVEDILGNFSGQARGGSDQALAVLGQELVVNARLVVKTFEEAQRTQLAEVEIAGVVLAEREEVGVVFVAPPGPVAAAGLGDVELAADNGFDTSVFCRLVEVDGAKEHAVVGNGAGLHIVVAALLKNFADLAGAVEHAVFGMAMEMGKPCAHSIDSSNMLRALSAVRIFTVWRSPENVHRSTVVPPGAARPM